MTDRYRHASALPLGYRARRALIAVLLATVLAIGALALIAASGIVAVYAWIAILS